MQLVEERPPEVRRAGQALERKICERSAKVGVIGLGYVGLPLVLEIAKAGFHVTGIDIDRAKVDSVNAGVSHIPDVPSETLLSLVKRGKIKATQSLAVIENLDTMSICVPHCRGRKKILTYRTLSPQWKANHPKPDQLIAWKVYPSW
jgi:UDP-N-acetyl-D-mannosaminuronate dehydrogenase